MNQAHRKFEIRCPIHGFIEINDWEREVINHPAFQRLRRIRQLAWTEFVYPGATHTRFEHSLGVMQVATRMYDTLVAKERERLQEEFAYNAAGFERDRQLVRFAALLHDVGHGPLSHASEGLMPKGADGKAFEHEDYSAAVIREKLRDVIESHALNDNYDLHAGEIAELLQGNVRRKKTLFWREALTGQVDADRMDYLLRDSHHAGVQYGHYDLNRIISTLTIAPETQDSGPRVALTEGGLHAAESVVLARYFMFTQVYFQKTRVAYNILLSRLLPQLLPGGQFPPPGGTGLDDYLQWDDWRVVGAVANGEGGEEGRMLRERGHYREVHHTPEQPTEEDLAKLQVVREALQGMEVVEQNPNQGKSWYKVGSTDIPIVHAEDGKREVRTLSQDSAVVASMKAINKTMLFVRPEHAAEARAKIEKATKP